jgi:hypothetical protein
MATSCRSTCTVRTLTVGVFGDRVGMPLRILLPEGTPYSFLRKYLLRPARAPLADPLNGDQLEPAYLKT